MPKVVDDEKIIVLIARPQADGQHKITVSGAMEDRSLAGAMLRAGWEALDAVHDAVHDAPEPKPAEQPVTPIEKPSES